MNTASGFGNPHDSRSVANPKKKLIPWIVAFLLFSSLCLVEGRRRSTPCRLRAGLRNGIDQGHGLYRRAVSSQNVLLDGSAACAVPSPHCHSRPTQSMLVRTELASLMGAIMGTIAILIVIFVSTVLGTDTGLAEYLSQVRDRGGDAGFSIGAWLTLDGFVVGGIVAVSFIIASRPLRRALATPSRYSQYPQPQGFPYSQQQPTYYHSPEYPARAGHGPAASYPPFKHTTESWNATFPSPDRRPAGGHANGREHPHVHGPNGVEG